MEGVGIRNRSKNSVRRMTMTTMAKTIASNHSLNAPFLAGPSWPDPLRALVRFALRRLRSSRRASAWLFATYSVGFVSGRRRHGFGCMNGTGPADGQVRRLNTPVEKRCSVKTSQIP